MKVQFNLFITKLNKLFNIACYRLASDLNLTNHLDTKNKGFEALIREVKKYTKYLRFKLKYFSVSPKIWVTLVLLVVLFSFLRLIYLFCFIFLWPLAVKDLLYYRYSNQEEIRPKTYGNIYFIECDMGNPRHISFKSVIALVHNLTFREAQVDVFRLNYQALKYFSRPYIISPTWLVLFIIVFALVTFIKKLFYIIPLLAFFKAWRWASRFCGWDYVSQFREVFNNNHLCRKIMETNELRIYKNDKYNWNFNPPKWHHWESVRSTSPGYNPYCNSGTVTRV